MVETGVPGAKPEGKGRGQPPQGRQEKDQGLDQQAVRESTGGDVRYEAVQGEGHGEPEGHGRDSPPQDHLLAHPRTARPMAAHLDGPQPVLQEGDPQKDVHQRVDVVAQSSCRGWRFSFTAQM